MLRLFFGLIDLRDLFAAQTLCLLMIILFQQLQTLILSCKIIVGLLPVAFCIKRTKVLLIFYLFCSCIAIGFML